MAAALPPRTPTEAIALWRRTAARLERLAGSAAVDQLEAAELLEVAARIRQYEAAAPFGATFDRAAGLKPSGPGVRHWWTVETIEAQRAAVARYVADHCADMSSGEAAKRLSQDLHRLERARGAPAGSSAALADAVALPRALPKSARTVRAILAANGGVEVAGDARQFGDDGDSHPPPDEKGRADK